MIDITTMDNADNKTQISKLDELWNNVIEYRKGQHFLEMMKACSRFRELAPYNAMIVQIQRPGVKYVLTAEQWRSRYGRIVKPDARPLVILVPFGPVEFVFDIGDTRPDPNQSPLASSPSDEEILNSIAEPYKTKRDVSPSMLYELICNLSVHGIDSDSFTAGSSYGAKIELRNDLNDIEIPFGKDNSVKWKASYIINVNRSAGYGESFASICHELGHLFCYHLSMPSTWNEKVWEVRNLDHKWEEFEAESVSWLVCERLGIGNPSERYLSYFADGGLSCNTIHSSVSIERILTATREVERMLKPLGYRDGLLYKHCQPFIQMCKDITKQRKGNHVQGIRFTGQGNLFHG